MIVIITIHRHHYHKHARRAFADGKGGDSSGLKKRTLKTLRLVRASPWVGPWGQARKANWLGVAWSWGDPWAPNTHGTWGNSPIACVPAQANKPPGHLGGPHTVSHLPLARGWSKAPCKSRTSTCQTPDLASPHGLPRRYTGSYAGVP